MLLSVIPDGVLNWPTGNEVIDTERRRLYELKQKAAQQGKALWEEKKLREIDCHSFESEDSSIASSGTSEKETR